jgi:hypothetical protein
LPPAGWRKKVRPPPWQVLLLTVVAVASIVGLATADPRAPGDMLQILASTTGLVLVVVVILFFTALVLLYLLQELAAHGLKGAWRRLRDRPPPDDRTRILRRGPPYAWNYELELAADRVAASFFPGPLLPGRLQILLVIGVMLALAVGNLPPGGLPALQKGGLDLSEVAVSAVLLVLAALLAAGVGAADRRRELLLEARGPLRLTRTRGLLPRVELEFPRPAFLGVRVQDYEREKERELKAWLRVFLSARGLNDGAILLLDVPAEHHPDLRNDMALLSSELQRLAKTEI